MRFSERTSWPEATNALIASHDAIKKCGREVIDLTESNPTQCGFGYLNPELLRVLGQPADLRYEPNPKGLENTRKTICGYYQHHRIKTDPSRIFVTSGTSESYSFLLSLLASEDESVLVPQPGYPLFDVLMQIHDVSFDTYRLDTYGDGWRLDLESVENRDWDTVKALIVVHPHNPAGHFVKKGERSALNRILKEKEAALISDEVFFDYAYGDMRDVSSFADNHDVLTFTLGGASKMLGLPQMKLSWIHVGGPEELVSEAIRRLEIIADTYLSVSVPIQNAVTQWMKNPFTARNEIFKRVLLNRRKLCEEISKNSKIRILPSEGGWYAILHMDSVRDDETFCINLLEKDGVFVHPGYFFNLDEKHLVLSLLQEPKAFQIGVSRLVNSV